MNMAPESLARSVLETDPTGVIPAHMAPVTPATASVAEGVLRFAVKDGRKNEPEPILLAMAIRNATGDVD